MIGDQFYESISRESIENLPESLLKDLYYTMLKIRIFDEKVALLAEKKEIFTPCHLYIGQETVAAGVCASLKSDDYVYSTHRSHGHYIAKGGDIRTLMAEIFGRVTGCSKGYGGSMHACSPDIGLPGSSAIVGGTIPIAVGTALAFFNEGKHRVSVAFFGDGAATEGVLYESLNFAKLKNMPVIFVCENNFYSTHLHISDMQSNIKISQRAEAFNVPAFTVDGNNVIRVYKTAKSAIEKARHSKGPSFIECLTYRWRGHVGPDWDLDKGIRNKEEVDWWVNNCGIKRMEKLLISEGILTEAEKINLIHKLSDEVEEAVEFAKNSPFPEVQDYKNEIFK